MTRSEVAFTADGNVELGAWLYLPKREASRSPAITMAHRSPLRLEVYRRRHPRPQPEFCNTMIQQTTGA